MSTRQRNNRPHGFLRALKRVAGDVYMRAAPTARDLIREMARLPLAAKIIIGLAILAEFVVITQWDYLASKMFSDSVAVQSPISSREPEQHSPDIRSDIDRPTVATVEAPPPIRSIPIIIENPHIEADGSIIGNGQTFHLFGIKQFNSKELCVRASGERWACGLHAYATLRNTVARNRMTCNPTTLRADALVATCSVGTINLAEMLVREGLVQLDDNVDDADLVKAQASARSRKIGIWDR